MKFRWSKKLTAGAVSFGFLLATESLGINLTPEQWAWLSGIVIAYLSGQSLVDAVLANRGTKKS